MMSSSLELLLGAPEFSFSHPRTATLAVRWPATPRSPRGSLSRGLLRIIERKRRGPVRLSQAPQAHTQPALEEQGNDGSDSPCQNPCKPTPQSPSTSPTTRFFHTISPPVNSASLTRLSRRPHSLGASAPVPRRGPRGRSRRASTISSLLCGPVVQQRHAPRLLSSAGAGAPFSPHFPSVNRTTTFSCVGPAAFDDKQSGGTEWKLKNSTNCWSHPVSRREEGSVGHPDDSLLCHPHNPCVCLGD
jgi:hypothetical protein